MKTKKIRHYLSAFLLMGFGLLTLFLSSSVIFDFFNIRAIEGNYVLVVVWSNFICSILYLFAAYGFIKTKKWTSLLLGTASIILIISFISLKSHILSGGLYELKTVSAMIFRISLTITFTLIAYFTINRQKKAK